MVETSLSSVWKKFAGECWRYAIIRMGEEVRKSCWEPITNLKLKDRPNGCLIVADRRFDMHLTVPPTTRDFVAHITTNKPKNWVWKPLPCITTSNVWWLDPDLLLKLFEGCQREKMSSFLMEAERHLNHVEQIIIQHLNEQLERVAQLVESSFSTL